MPRLAPEQVEVLAGGGAVDDADVLLRGHLHEPLDARARMLGPVPLVAVREQQREPRRLPPLGERRDDELVDDDLRAVHEVAELGLPDDERVRARDRVAVLEAETAGLGERRVVDLERRDRVRQMLDRRVLGARLRVVEDEVAVRERAALRVLARDSHGRALLDQAPERERLGERPVDPAVGTEHVAAALELGQELGMNREVRRDDQELVVQRLEPVARNRGLGHVAAGAAGLALLPPAHRALGDRLPQRVVRDLDLAVGLGEHRLRRRPR